MGLASLGARKYGQLCNSISDRGRNETPKAAGKVTVWNVPIIIEGGGSDRDIKTETARKAKRKGSRAQLSFSKFSQTWNIPEDLVSLNPLPSGKCTNDRIVMVVRPRVGRNGEAEREEGKGGLSRIHNHRDLKLEPFSDISQVIINNQISIFLFSIQRQGITDQTIASRKSNLLVRQKLNKTGRGITTGPQHTLAQRVFGGEVTN